MDESYELKIASESDFEKWLDFADSVRKDFYDINLKNNTNYRSVIEKNIKRKTAIIAEDKEKIIGAMTYSMHSKHISWLAVSEKCRRKGIGTALVRCFFSKFNDDDVLMVKTFTESDNSGERAHAFYRKNGFIAEEIEADLDGNNDGHPFQIFRSYIRK